MLVPLSWLKDYVELTMPVDAFAQKMAVMGTNVETVMHLRARALGIITVRIEEMHKHAQADKLWVCTVFDGNEKIVVVTAAKNVHEGDVVAYAPEGASLADGTTMGSREFKGVLSHGMFCSSEEMGLEAKISPKHLEGGVYVFPAGTQVGEDALELLGRNDDVIDFELTNNRQDCNSILGIAYEAGACMGKRFSMPDFSVQDQTQTIREHLSVCVEDQSLCPRYMARMLKVKKIEPSPLWMQRRLMSCNIRPINNIVDVSNYVLLELSQPLHMFDYDQLAGHQIHVRPAKEGEEVVTLDGETRTLHEGTITICDTEKIVCIAGVMGAENSEITDQTKTIVIESALFDKNAIRKTSRELGLRSDASANFEKGISIVTQPVALDRAAQLLVKIGACELIEGTIDVVDASHRGLSPSVVRVRTDEVNRLLGMEISAEDMRRCLELLAFDVEQQGEVLIVTAPAFRQDIQIKEDVIEEIARVYGYDKIPSTLMDDSSYISSPNMYYQKKEQIKQTLLGVGGTEILTYAFISPWQQDALLLDAEASGDCVRVQNPLGEDYSVMRTSLAANMLSVLALNQNKKNDPVLLFEIGHVFFPNQDAAALPVQKECVALGKFGADFFDLKSVVAHLFESLKVENIVYRRSSLLMLHPGKSADIYCADKKIGFLGCVHPRVASAFGLKGTCVIAQLDVETLIAHMKDKIVCEPQAKFPAMARDLSVLIEQDVLAADVLESIRDAGCKYLESAKVFDVYTGEGVPQGKKSLSVTMYFRSSQSTLTYETTQNEFDLVLKKLADTFGAVQR